MLVCMGKPEDADPAPLRSGIRGCVGLGLAIYALAVASSSAPAALITFCARWAGTSS